MRGMKGGIGEEDCQRDIISWDGKALVGMYALIYGGCDMLVFDILTLKGHSLY